MNNICYYDLIRYLSWLDEAVKYDLPKSKSQLFEWINSKLSELASVEVWL